MKKVLIAEDDQFIAQAYRDKLKLEGFEVQLAEDGVQTLNLLKSFHPDVLILDLVMPKLDGFGVLAELQKQNSKIKVIVASNLSQEEDQERARKLGASGFLIKSDTPIAKMVEMVKS